MKERREQRLCEVVWVEQNVTVKTGSLCTKMYLSRVCVCDCVTGERMSVCVWPRQEMSQF